MKRLKELKDIEKIHGTVYPEKMQDGVDHPDSVRIGIELADTSLRTIPVFDDSILDIQVSVRGMDGHLRFDLKAFGKNREGFDKAEVEGPVAGHDVPDIRLEEMVDSLSHKSVSKIMKQPFVFFKIR